MGHAGRNGVVSSCAGILSGGAGKRNASVKEFNSAMSHFENEK
jgi:hypothetical protein